MCYLSQRHRHGATRWERRDSRSAFRTEIASDALKDQNRDRGRRARRTEPYRSIMRNSADETRAPTCIEEGEAARTI